MTSLIDTSAGADHELRDTLGVSLSAARERAASRLAAAQREMDTLTDELERFANRDLDRLLFTVRIYDPWDAALSAHQQPGSGEATARGLRNAVQAAERGYTQRHGSQPRTDGVLSYTVTAHFEGADVAVPDAAWMTYSVQQPGSIRDR